MKRPKQFLAMMLAATLTVGSMQSGVYAAQTARAGNTDQSVPATTAQQSSGFAANDAVRTYSQTFQTQELPVSASLMDTDNFTSDPSQAAASTGQSGFTDAMPVPGVEAFLNRTGNISQITQDESGTDETIEEETVEEETGSESESSQDGEGPQNTDITDDTQNPSDVQEETDDTASSAPLSDEANEGKDKEPSYQESSKVVSDESSTDGTDEGTDEMEENSSDNASDNTTAPVSEEDSTQVTEESSDQKDQDLQNDSGTADTEKANNEDNEDIVNNPGDEADAAGTDDASDSSDSTADENVLTEDSDTLDGETYSDIASNGTVDNATDLTAQTLSSDLTINGDAVITKSGIIDLNGHTLTIIGSLLHSNGALVVRNCN